MALDDEYAPDDEPDRTREGEGQGEEQPEPPDRTHEGEGQGEEQPAPRPLPVQMNGAPGRGVIDFYNGSQHQRVNTLDPFDLAFNGQSPQYPGHQPGAPADVFQQSLHAGLQHINSIIQQMSRDPRMYDAHGQPSPHLQHALGVLYGHAGHLAQLSKMGGPNGQNFLQPAPQAEYSPQQKQELARQEGAQQKLLQDYSNGAIDEDTFHRAMAERMRDRQRIGPPKQPVQKQPTIQELAQQQTMVHPQSGHLMMMEQTKEGVRWHAVPPVKKEQPVQTPEQALQSVKPWTDPNTGHTHHLQWDGKKWVPLIPHGETGKGEAGMTQKEYVAAEHTVRQEIDRRIHEQKMESLKKPDGSSEAFKPTLTDDMREQAIVQEKRNRGLGRDWEEYQQHQKSGRWVGGPEDRAAQQGQPQPPTGAPQQGQPQGPPGAQQPWEARAKPVAAAFQQIGNKASEAGDKEAMKASMLAPSLLNQYQGDVNAMPAPVRQEYISYLKALKKHAPGLQIPPE